VSVRRVPGAITVEIADDGPAAASGGGPAPVGNGVRGMRERAAALGGRLQTGPAEGGGWRVQAWLPTAPPVADGAALISAEGP
jgi:signal transduction histidine kinase